MGGDLPALVTAVEQPGGAALLGPRAAVDERRLVDVAAQDDVGPVLLEQPGQLRIAVVPGSGPGQRALRGSVVHPEPRARPRARRPAPAPPRGAASVSGPSHHAHAVTSQPSTITLSPSTTTPRGAGVEDPRGGLLVARGAVVEVVVARAGHRGGPLGEPGEVLRAPRRSGRRGARVDAMSSRSPATTSRSTSAAWASTQSSLRRS